MRKPGLKKSVRRNTRRDVRGLATATHRSAKEKREAAEKKRLIVARNTLVVFICGCLLLALMGVWHRSSRTVSATEYLLAENAAGLTDPLHLTERLGDLELTGVSADGCVIGYESTLSCAQVVMLLKAALESDGWVLVDDNGQGLLSYQHDGLGTAFGSRLLVQCLAVGQESSIVVQRW